MACTPSQSAPSASVTTPATTQPSLQIGIEGIGVSVPHRPAQPVTPAAYRRAPTPGATPATIGPSEVAPATLSNHLVIPSLGVDTVHGAFCGSTGLPPGLFRFTCATVESTYLLSHNWSTLSVLQAAYRAGTLAMGTEAIYTDAAGVTRRYRLSQAFTQDKVWVNSMDANPFRASMFAPCGGCIWMQTCRDGSATTPSTRWLFTRWDPAG